MRSQPSMLLSLCLFACSLLSSQLVTTAAEPHIVTHSGLVKGYYPSYNSVNQGQHPSQIPYDLYTDLIFFSVEPAADWQIKYNHKLTYAQGEKLAAEFVALARQKNVKSLLSFGGWIASRYFSNYTSTESARKKFAQKIVMFTKSRGFNGIEIDWECEPSRFASLPHPDAVPIAGIGCNSHNPQDTVNFGLLTKEIRAMWPGVQISAAIGITGLIGANGSPATPTETAYLVENLDYINLMAYDVFGGWSATTGPIAPLHATCAPAAAAQSVETGLQAVLNQGFKHRQIVMGIPTYSKRLELVSSTLVPTSVNGHTSYYYQNHTNVTPPGGKFDDKPMVDVCGVNEPWGGSFLFKELISNGWLSADHKTGINRYKRHFDECSGQPFLTNGKYFISYDDETSTASKAQFAKDKNLAGIFFFDTQGPTDSILRAARQAIRGESHC